jgi:hypothetical protein
MWTGAIILSLVAAVSSAGAQPPVADCATWQACRDAVEAAITDEAFERALDLAWRAVQKGPKDDPALMFLLARAEARAGRPQDALVMVRRLAERGVRTEALAHPDLERVRNLDAWAEVEPLVARANEGAPAPNPAPARNAKTASPPASPPAPSAAPTPPASSATTSHEAAPTASRRTSRGSIPIDSAGLSEDVLRFSTDRFTPSGLAYDAVSRRFVVGDQRGRKLRVVGEGQDHAVDLVRSESAGFYDIRALGIDTRRGDLWVVTSDAAETEGTVHRLQLVSGRPLQSLPLAGETGRSIHPVDLAIAESGAVFLLHRDGRIQRVRPGSPTIDTVAALKGIEEASTLALASNDTIAYVADAKGLHRVDLGNGSAAAVTTAAELPLTGLERLRAHRGGFVALQRSPDGERRLLRLELNRTGRAVRAATTYDVRVEVGSPTAFAVSGDEVSIVSGAPATAADVDTSPAVGPPAELAVRRFRLRE